MPDAGRHRMCESCREACSQCGIAWRQSVQRREFITLLAGAALIGPRPAIAQTPKVYRLGTLTAGPPMGPASDDAAVLIGALKQRGYKPGQNLTYEARGAAGQLSQMPKQMQELKTANVDVVVTVSYPAAVIAKSSGIPTVIATGSGDPVATGLVASLARPGGNVTGISDVATTFHQASVSAQGDVAATAPGRNAVEQGRPRHVAALRGIGGGCAGAWGHRPATGSARVG